MPYSKLKILTELSANDVKFISVDRQKLDLSKYITYGTVSSIFVEIQPDSTNIKNDPRIADLSLKIVFWTHKFAVGLIDMGNSESQDP